LLTELFVFKLTLKCLNSTIRYPEITDISFVTDTISICRKKRYLGYSTDTLDADNIDIGDISRYFQYIVARHFGVKHWKFYYVNKREKY